ncbi:MAG: hypothetical protein RI953_45 [Pseudomonadota bacterium]|jgi:hypothetical protein
MSNVDSIESTSEKSDSWEVYFGLALSVFAAFLAINELGGSKFGDDEIQLGNEKTKAYMWYQSKSIKESLAKGQVELLDVLSQSGAIATDKAAAMSKLKDQIKQDVVRYKKEKDEILRGSKAVGPENYAQDVDGKMGVVVGAKEIEDQQAGLSEAGDKFDIATLFLQISLVLGAIGLITKSKNVRLYFFAGLVSLGLTGSVFCFLAFRSAFAASGG